MTTKKGTDSAARQGNKECCMCGDLGFSEQLFQCKVCQFRSQHRYCSNLYPKPESVGTCNWCLIQKEDRSSPNSSNSSSPYRNNNGSGADEESRSRRLRKGLRGSNSPLQLHKPIKKQHKSPEPDAEARSPSSTSPSPSPSPSILISTRKRIVTTGALEERLRRTKSEDITNRRNNSAPTKQAFRNKVKRYKLLEEVSS